MMSFGKSGSEILLHFESIQSSSNEYPICKQTKVAETGQFASVHSHCCSMLRKETKEKCVTKM